MALFLLSFVLITLAVLGMAVGVLCGRRALTGSCGGLNRIEGFEAVCESCASPCEKGRHFQDVTHAEAAGSSWIRSETSASLLNEGAREV